MRAGSGANTTLLATPWRGSPGAGVTGCDLPELREKICFSVQKAPANDETKNEIRTLTLYWRACRQRNFPRQNGLGREVAAEFGARSDVENICMIEIFHN